MTPRKWRIYFPLATGRLKAKCLLDVMGKPAERDFSAVEGLFFSEAQNREIGSWELTSRL